MGRKRKNSEKPEERTDKVLGLTEALANAATFERRETKRPVDIDGRVTCETESTRYDVGAISATIDFKRLCRDMLVMADGIFESVFIDDFQLEFREGSSIKDAVNEYVARSLRQIDGNAIFILSDYYREMLLFGAISAAEGFAEVVSKAAGLEFTKSDRKHFRDVGREHASALLAQRFPGVGRGGNRSSPSSGPSDDTLMAFHEAVQRLAPFWEDAKRRKDRGDDAWLAHAKSLPEYLAFTADEKRHAGSVLNLLRKGREVNGSPPYPRTLPREHARLIVGITHFSDSQLRQFQADGKRAASRLTQAKKSSASV